MDNRTLAPLVISIITFVFVFNMFYSVFAPPPLMIANVQMYTPKGYVAPNDQPEKVIVHVTRFSDLVVYEFWYYWPYDGNVKKDDWEPVVVYVKGDGSVYAVASRIHYVWRVNYNPIIADGTHIVVTFRYAWHNPLFVEPPKGYVEVSKEPVLGTPPEELDHASILGRIDLLENPLILGTIVASIASASSFVITRRLVAKA